MLVSCVAALLALGMVMLYSSSMVQFGTHYLVKQLVGCAIGVILCLIAASLDYRRLKKFAWPLFALAVVLLVLVFLPHIGIRRNGASRWLGYGKTTLFQPSEFAKLALIIVLAWYCEWFQRQMPTLKRGMVIPGLFIGLMLGLVFKEPDVGNMLLMATVSGVLLLIGGIRLRYFLPPVIAGALAVSLFIYHNPMRSERIYSWLHLEETKQGKGVQAYQAMVALGSGGITGKGLGDGRQKLGFVPEHHTDFIFSIIGEELGLIATLLVIAAFVVIVFCGIYIAMKAADTFGLLLGSGITFLIGLQAFINIGVVTGALPNKGLPLPFISYGGSNLLIALVSVGLLLSIARQARESDGGIRDVLPEREGANPFARGKQSNP
ncbi:MAG: putative lipid II flippase FtsW [Verrucomicrobia bacterium]|nr:putative lipid II flippase FtsW [Verrucomicrobiota bacterium]